ncbi:unnamed protein product [Amoebophrya sp. A120]|nr:unnamed protein product [Amoebophrya sp. A120]|eukprot:GSA120T00015399001.1
MVTAIRSEKSELLFPARPANNGKLPEAGDGGDVSRVVAVYRFADDENEDSYFAMAAAEAEQQPRRADGSLPCEDLVRGVVEGSHLHAKTVHGRSAPSCMTRYSCAVEREVYKRWKKTPAALQAGRSCRDDEPVVDDERSNTEVVVSGATRDTRICRTRPNDEGCSLQGSCRSSNPKLLNTTESSSEDDAATSSSGLRNRKQIVGRSSPSGASCRELGVVSESVQDHRLEIEASSSQMKEAASPGRPQKCAAFPACAKRAEEHDLGPWNFLQNYTSLEQRLDAIWRAVGPSDGPDMQRLKQVLKENCTQIRVAIVGPQSDNDAIDVSHEKEQTNDAHGEDRNAFGPSNAVVLYSFKDGSTFFGAPPFPEGSSSTYIHPDPSLASFYRVHNGVGLVLSPEKDLWRLLRNPKEFQGGSAFYVFPASLRYEAGRCQSCHSSGKTGHNNPDGSSSPGPVHLLGRIDKNCLVLCKNSTDDDPCQAPRRSAVGYADSGGTIEWTSDEAPIVFVRATIENFVGVLQSSCSLDCLH